MRKTGSAILVQPIVIYVILFQAALHVEMDLNLEKINYVFVKIKMNILKMKILINVKYVCLIVKSVNQKINVRFVSQIMKMKMDNVRK